MNDEGHSLDALPGSISPLAMQVVQAAAGGLTSGMRESSADVWGALVGDKLKIWRLKNLVDGLEKAASHISRKGVNLAAAKSLPMGDMLAIFDGVSKEDDKNLSDMWARLVAEAMTENDNSSVSVRSVAALLGQMSPESARVFMFLAKEKKASLLDAKLSKISNRELFPLAENEGTLDEVDLREDYDRTIREVKDEWQNVSAGGPSIEARFEIAKGELARLNLIDRKKLNVYFDDSPFRRGHQITEDGLDKVISEMQERVQELVDSRTNTSQHPFFDRSRAMQGSNFQLSQSGTEIAKKLGLL